MSAALLNTRRVAVVGAGWAGMAAAVAAAQSGAAVTVLEANRRLGGRARALPVKLPDGSTAVLDNGQHILVGAYTECLRLMHLVGVDPNEALLRQALSMPFVDGTGLQTPAWAAAWPAPLDAVAAIATARGWNWAERWSLIRASLGWQWAGFRCPAPQTVAELCHALAPRVMRELIEPLCVSALNTPAHQASAQVFLRVLKDALFGIRGGSNLLLPRRDMGALFPDAAARWLQNQGHAVHCGVRVTSLQWKAPHWWLEGQAFDRVIWATSARHAAFVLMESALDAPEPIADAMYAWSHQAADLRFESIATVYAWGKDARLPTPMLALRCAPEAPAQFVFDRGQLGGLEGLLAFVVSASSGSREEVEAAVMAQAQRELAPLGIGKLDVIKTVIEKSATFACTPALARPPQEIAPGLLAAGDYVAGPYPATLEGAVRSGWVAGLHAD